VTVLGNASPKKRPQPALAANRAPRKKVTKTDSLSKTSRQIARRAITLSGPSVTGAELRDASHVGPRLRARREALGISLRQFARDQGISASFISQIETGKAQPSVATLYAICRALDMSLDELYSIESPPAPSAPARPRRSAKAPTSAPVDEIHLGRATRPFGAGRSPVVRSSERKSITMESGVTWERLTSTSVQDSSFTFVRYDVGGSSNSDGSLIRHIGTEYWYVISGFLDVTLGFETYRLGAGDSISFNSSTPHRLSNAGDTDVEAIWFDVDHDFQTP
jgi:transcriptional regulator with XRE-family HTH domain